MFLTKKLINGTFGTTTIEPLRRNQTSISNIPRRPSFLLRSWVVGERIVRLCNDYEPFPCFNTMRPRQNGCHFTDDIFKCILLNENVRFPIKISLKVVPKGQINKIPALVQIMAWRRPGDKSLSEPMMVSLPTHICVIRLQWVKEA